MKHWYALWNAHKYNYRISYRSSGRTRGGKKYNYADFTAFWLMINYFIAAIIATLVGGHFFDVDKSQQT